MGEEAVESMATDDSSPNPWPDGGSWLSEPAVSVVVSSKKLRLKASVAPAPNDTSAVSLSADGAPPKPAANDWSSLNTSMSLDNCRYRISRLWSAVVVREKRTTTTGATGTFVDDRGEGARSGDARQVTAAPVGGNDVMTPKWTAAASKLPRVSSFSSSPSPPPRRRRRYNDLDGRYSGDDRAHIPTGDERSPTRDGVVAVFRPRERTVAIAGRSKRRRFREGKPKPNNDPSCWLELERRCARPLVGRPVGWDARRRRREDNDRGR